MCTQVSRSAFISYWYDATAIGERSVLRHQCRHDVALSTRDSAHCSLSQATHWNSQGSSRVASIPCRRFPPGAFRVKSGDKRERGSGTVATRERLCRSAHHGNTLDLAAWSLPEDVAQHLNRGRNPDTSKKSATHVHRKTMQGKRAGKHPGYLPPKSHRESPRYRFGALGGMR